MTQGRIHSFNHSFGQGRVFYYGGEPGYCEDPNPKVNENGLELFEAGLLWAATGCTRPTITIQPQNQLILSGESATLSVDATAPIPLSYQWYQGTSGNTANPIIGATLSTYQTPALTQTTNYWVRVSTSCGYADSNTATITVNPGTAPSLPTNVSATDGTYTNKIQVTWTASSGATSYTVYRSIFRQSVKIPLGTITGTSFDDTSASPGRIYYYWVKASNSYGTSGFSNSDKGYR